MWSEPIAAVCEAHLPESKHPFDDATEHDVCFKADGTVATLTFSGIPPLEDNYTLTIVSGDLGFEDVVGRDLDGEYLGSLPSGDGFEGAILHCHSLSISILARFRRHWWNSSLLET